MEWRTTSQFSGRGKAFLHFLATFSTIPNIKEAKVIIVNIIILNLVWVLVMDVSYIEMFYLNTIEKLFIIVEQLNQLEVCQTYHRLLNGILIRAVSQNLRWNSNKTSLSSFSRNCCMSIVCHNLVFPFVYLSHSICKSNAMKSKALFLAILVT